MTLNLGRPASHKMVSPNAFPDPAVDVAFSEESDEQVAVLAGGCFWCVEAVFKALDGVRAVTSGYAGGSAETADYPTVCGGATNHAEVVAVNFDPGRITYGQLLKVFFSIAHDPTQRDRQGADIGRQYRSAIFYANSRQREVAKAYIAQLDRAGVFDAPIATRVEPLEAFFEAEGFHQDYAARNPAQTYVAVNVAPKIAKLQRHFANTITDSSGAAPATRHGR